MIKNAINLTSNYGLRQAYVELVVNRLLPAMMRLRYTRRMPVYNLVPRAFSATIYKMAARRDKTLGKAGSRGTKSPKILEIFIT